MPVVPTTRSIQLTGSVAGLSVVYRTVRVEPLGIWMNDSSLARNASQKSVAPSPSHLSSTTIWVGFTRAEFAAVVVVSCARTVPPGVTRLGATFLSIASSTSG